MLDKEVARVEQELRNYEKAVSEFGVAVASDGKDAVNRKHLVNILSSNPTGLPGSWLRRSCRGHSARHAVLTV